MEAIIWKNETRKLSELIPWPINPAQIGKDEAKRLEESLAEFGQIQTIAISPTNEIYDGHQRQTVWGASRKFGMDYEVDVRVSSRELTEQERKKLVIYLRKGTVGQFDWDILANNFEMDDLLNWGFDERELQLNYSDLDQPKPWIAEEQDEFFADPNGDGIELKAGYRLGSIWYGMTAFNEPRKYMLDLPRRPDAKDGATVKLKYSRTNAEEIERCIKTYMRTGDVFFEMCCGWMTFSSTAKYFGFSGKGGDIWDISLEFCKRQISGMPGEGRVEVVYADCRDTKEPENHYDFIHSNPPFFSLEPYGESVNDLASLGDYERWVDAMGDMGREAERILKPGGLANFVINDYRKNGEIVLMHADFIAGIKRKSNLILHDLVVAEVISQALRFRQHDYERRRTVKCHEYVITFKKPGLISNGTDEIPD